MIKRLVLILFLIGQLVWAQDPSRFADDVSSIVEKYESLPDSEKETIVFTGSSSVRLWKNIPDLFPKHQIINSGFGGSQASDLKFYLNELVLKYNPDKVFIYEGDNDLAEGKKSEEIITDLTGIIKKLKTQNKNIDIVLIAAKPSISRWKLKRDYKKLNKKFKKLCKSDEHLYFADIWKPMLNKKKVKEDIFTEDGLHMNAKGYVIWYDVIKNFIKY